METKSLSLIVAVLFVIWLLAVGLATGILKIRNHFKRKRHTTHQR